MVLETRPDAKRLWRLEGSLYCRILNYKGNVKNKGQITFVCKDDSSFSRHWKLLVPSALLVY